MSYPINYPTPQNADVQIFSIGGSTSDWVKPQGCSFVYIILLGAGGNGFGGTTSAGGAGGGGGATTICLVPAFLIPDILRVSVGQGGVGNTTANRTRIEYQLRIGTGYELMFANSGPNATGSGNAGTGSAFNGSYFTAAGFLFSSVTAQSGSAGGSLTQSTLNLGGAGGATTTTGNGGSITPLFGYPVRQGGAGTTGENGQEGISIISDLFLSCGGSGGGGSTTGSGGNGGNGGIGSGGGGGGICTTGTSQGGKGGDGIAVIVSW